MNHTHLWNNLPLQERERLHPYMIEQQILHLKQAREVIARRQAATLKEIDDWIKNCERSLKDAEQAQGTGR